MSEKFRIEKRSNFTVVSNDILMNNFMSMKATCLSIPGGFTPLFRRLETIVPI